MVFQNMRLNWILKSAHEMFGLNYVIFRPHNVYGENQNIGDKYRNVIGIFMNQIMQGKQLTIFGDGSQTRAFSYIDDVAIPIATSVQIQGAYNQVFNIGADKPYTVNELAKVVANQFGVKADINYLNARNEVLHAYADHTKAHKSFWMVEVALILAQGIAKWPPGLKKSVPGKVKNLIILKLLRNFLMAGIFIKLNKG